MATDWLGNQLPDMSAWSGAPTINFGSLSQMPGGGYYQDPTSKKYYLLGHGDRPAGPMTGDLSSWPAWSHVNIAGTPDVATGWGVQGATGTNQAYEFASDPSKQFVSQPPTKGSGKFFTLNNILGIQGGDGAVDWGLQSLRDNPVPTALIGGAIGGFAAGAGAFGGAGSSALNAGAGAFDAAGFAGTNVLGGAAVPAATTAGGGMDWFEQLMQGFNPDLGFQGLNEAGSGLTGGMAGAATSGIDWSNIDRMIQELGTNAGEAENLATAQSINQQAPGLLQRAKQLLDAGSSAKQIASLLGISEGAVNLIGKLGAAGLQAFGSNQQSNSLNQLAQQQMGFGAPSRGRFEAAMTPGFDPNSIPGYAGALDTASKSILARLSARDGNPFGSPGGLIQANKDIVSGTALPAINEYTRQKIGRAHV